jgi:hypothetical protein
MLGLNNVFRFAAFSLIGLGATALLSSNANAQAPTLGTKNSIYARSGGTNWTYSLIDNFDTNNDGIPESRFAYYITRSVNYTGDVRKRTYNMAATTVRLEGNIQQSPDLKYWATYAPGGMYGLGVSSFIIYRDSNNNGVQDLTEVVVLNGSRGCALTGIAFSYASTFDLDRNGVISSPDVTLFNTLLGSQNLTADFNGSGVVDNTDYLLLTARVR